MSCQLQSSVPTQAHLNSPISHCFYHEAHLKTTFISHQTYVPLLYKPHCKARILTNITITQNYKLGRNLSSQPI